MTIPTKIAWESEYEDGSGIEYAVRYDATSNEHAGEIELESVDKISFGIDQLEWLIECLTAIKKETGL